MDRVRRIISAFDLQQPKQCQRNHNPSLSPSVTKSKPTTTRVRPRSKLKSNQTATQVESSLVNKPKFLNQPPLTAKHNQPQPKCNPEPINPNSMPIVQPATPLKDGSHSSAYRYNTATPRGCEKVYERTDENQ